jgi:hypothetical protein
MYYPLSQITSNLYTNGNEFFLNGESYTGYYFKISKGRYFTGKTPNDLPNLEIFPITQDFWEATAETEQTGKSFIQLADVYDGLVYNNQTQNPENNSIYNNLKTSQQITFIPSHTFTIPTQQDYQIGEFRRYFCKKVNDITYLEINKDTHDKLVNKDPQIEYSLYIPFYISWQLTGNKQQVARTNKNIVDLTMKRLSLPKFNLYLKEDYTKYYQ